jgi:hypothetical protein
VCNLVVANLTIVKVMKPRKNEKEEKERKKEKEIENQRNAQGEIVYYPTVKKTST